MAEQGPGSAHTRSGTAPATSLIVSILIRRLRSLVPAFLAAGLSACGGSPSGPSPSSRLQLTSVIPGAGTTAGGTSVRISGVNFATGATVTIGGKPATEVSVIDSSTLTAVTPAHDAGSTDVIVSVNGQSATLASAYTFSTNAPPVIASISVKGSKPREPSQFADIDETVSVSAVVTDGETPVSQLLIDWSADAGTFSGTGPNVTWTAPHTFTTPGDVTLRLTVTERYQAGNSASGENQVKGTTKLRLHNSPKEVGDMAVDFLTSFSKQLDPAIVMKNFTTKCSGTAEELSDVKNNQVDFTITSYKIGTADNTQVLFTGLCSFPDRIVQGDACAYVPAQWVSYIKSATYHPELKPYVGKTMSVSGTDLVSAVLENDQWRLCGSNWDQTSATVSSLDTRFTTQTNVRFKR
jgi:IPT/TIG domain